MATATAPLRFDARTQSGAGLRAFRTICDTWGLTEEQRLILLGRPGRSTYYHWMGAKDVVLGPDTLERLSYILGIYKALHVLLPGDAADRWIRRPNSDPLFGGRPAIDFMLRGRVGDLLRVRDYLDTQRGW